MRNSLAIRALEALAAAALVAALAAPAHAGKGDRYYFNLAKLDLKTDAPDAVREQVRAALDEAFEANDAILVTLPAGAPDPKANPKAFKRYLKKNDIRAYDVRVEITQYERAVEELDKGRSGRRLKVGIALRLFGETIPDRVMGFAGAGSATIKLDVGKKIRDRDEEVAHEDAIELAVADAVKESLIELNKPPPTQRPNKNKKKKRRGKKKS